VRASAGVGADRLTDRSVIGLMRGVWPVPESIVTALCLCHEAIPMVTGLIWAPAHRHKKTLGVNLGFLLLF
jgi:hypothetical protein